MMRFPLLYVIPLLPFSCAATAQDVALFDAIAQRDAVTVRQMLAADPSLANARKPNGISAVTAALFAIKKGEESFPDPKSNDVLTEVLAHEPKLDAFEVAAVGDAKQLAAMIKDDPDALQRRAKYGWTLLHVAAYGGNVPNTELLIKLGADVNSRAKSRFLNTPLQTALLSGQYGTARVLVEHGADVLVRQAEGFTPMHEAAELGRVDLVQLLLDHGAEVNSVADNGQTPLAVAMKAHRDDVIALLKSKGATIEPVRNTAEK